MVAWTNLFVLWGAVHYYPLVNFGLQGPKHPYLALSSSWFNLAIENSLMLKGPLQTQPPWLDLEKAHGQLAQSSTLNNLELPLTKLLGGTVSYSNVSCRHTCNYYSFFKKNDVFIIIKWMDSFALSPLWKQTKIWDINAIVECSQLIVKNQQLKIAKSPQVLEVKNWKEKLVNLAGQNFLVGAKTKKC